MKELIGATIDEKPLDQRLQDIQLSDDESHSELKLTDVEPSQQVNFWSILYKSLNISSEKKM